jgi:four helix bundle protein
MRDHKSLLAWQEANAVVRAVMTATRGRRHPCIDQLQRAALSVQLNIAEGYALRSSRRFRNHLDIAYASAVETAELLELTSELKLLPADQADPTVGRCRRCQSLLLGLIKRVRRSHVPA